MISLIKATVLRAEFLTTTKKKTATNFPLYPWDNQKELETHIRRAAKQTGCTITRIYKTKRYVKNPLVE